MSALLGLGLRGAVFSALLEPLRLNPNSEEAQPEGTEETEREEAGAILA
jgi:hypothetical protein